MNPLAGGLLTGAAFGVVLYKVGATRYSRVMGMLTLRDTKVMKFAFTAIGVASLLYGLAAALGVAEPAHLMPRTMPYLGLAHVVGGVLFGASLGISGTARISEPWRTAHEKDTRNRRSTDKSRHTAKPPHRQRIHT